MRHARQARFTYPARACRRFTLPVVVKGSKTHLSSDAPMHAIVIATQGGLSNHFFPQSFWADSPPTFRGIPSAGGGRPEGLHGRMRRVERGRDIRPRTRRTVPLRPDPTARPFAALRVSARPIRLRSKQALRPCPPRRRVGAEIAARGPRPTQSLCAIGRTGRSGHRPRARSAKRRTGAKIPFSCNKARSRNV